MGVGHAAGGKHKRTYGSVAYYGGAGVDGRGCGKIRAPGQAPLVRAKARNPMTVYMERCLLLFVRTDPHTPNPREDRRQHE